MFDAPAKDVKLLITCADNIYLTNLLEESTLTLLAPFSLVKRGDLFGHFDLKSFIYIFFSIILFLNEVVLLHISEFLIFFILFCSSFITTCGCVVLVRRFGFSSSYGEVI